MLNARLLYPEKVIRETIREMGIAAAKHQPKPDVVIPIMRGACLFGPDLFREINRHGCFPEYYPLTLKRGEDGKPRAVDGHVYKSFKDKTVLIADTMCDSGVTIAYAIQLARTQMHAKHVLIAHLFYRDEKKLPDNASGGFLGFALETNDYLFGYGLDRNDRFRGLASVWAEPPSAAVPESLLGPQDKS